MGMISPKREDQQIVFDNVVDIESSLYINKLNKIYGNNTIINGLDCGFNYEKSLNLLKVYLKKGSLIADDNLFFLDNDNIFELDLTEYINEERYIFLIFYLKSGDKARCGINKRVNIELVIYDFDLEVILYPKGLEHSSLYFIGAFYYFDKQNVIDLTPNYSTNKKVKMLNTIFYIRPINKLSLGFNKYLYDHYFPINL